MKSNTTSFLQLLLVLLALAAPSQAYYPFRLRIPNGEIVPHPCKANYMWDGVGHKAPKGGGDRNVFGLDFKAAGLRWTEELCRKDSDGDGKTNGEELGDPDCQWKKGDVPKIVTGITHPGICNPYGQGKCAGNDTYVDCSIQSFGEGCDVIKEPGVMTEDLKFKKHTIPNTETNYYCQYFDLPQAQDYQIVAQEPIIDNRNVLHHMLLHGCPDTYESKPSDNSPSPCYMGGNKGGCAALIGGWTVGKDGNCYGESVGFKFGRSGYKKVKLEIHYNNPLLVANYTDETAFRLYYRPWNSSVQELSSFMVGQALLEIPPGKQSVVAKSSCTSSCTQRMITKPMHVFSASNHMHYMGRSQKTEVIRDGKVVKVLAYDEHYSYDSPHAYRIEPPFQVLPGDELATTCSYSSLSRKHWVFYGDGTADEMCYSFLTVYPADAVANVQWCVSYGPLDHCDLQLGTPKLGCDWYHFSNLSQPQMTKHYMNLERNCNLNGVCREECKPLADDLLKHPCLQKEMSPIITKIMANNVEGARFLGSLHSCSGSKDTKAETGCQQGPGDAGS